MNVSPKVALTIVRAYLVGKDEQWTADATGLHVRAVRQVAEHYGHPDAEQLQVARDELEARAAAPRVATGDGEALERALNEGLGSPRKATRAMAERARRDLDRLRQRVDDESADAARKRQAERERAKAAADVARLRKQLADAQARLRGKPAEPSAAAPKREVPAPDRDYDPRVVRAWAAENGVECGANGRVPARVVDAWREATQAAQDGSESEAS